MKVLITQNERFPDYEVEIPEGQRLKSPGKTVEIGEIELRSMEAVIASYNRLQKYLKRLSETAP